MLCVLQASLPLQLQRSYVCIASPTLVVRASTRCRWTGSFCCPLVTTRWYSRLLIKKQHIGAALEESVGGRKACETSTDDDNLCHGCSGCGGGCGEYVRRMQGHGRSSSMTAPEHGTGPCEFHSGCGVASPTSARCGVRPIRCLRIDRITLFG